MAGTSKKTAVIEWIFFNRKFDQSRGLLLDSVVTFADLSEGIAAAGDGLSNKNPANFWKDLTRRDLNKMWPSAVADAGYAGADAIGLIASACFQFVPIPRGQVRPFVDFVELRPGSVLEHTVQSLSMPVAMRALGRRDENWLSQIAARLNLVETHFAVFSARPVLEVAFLQTGVKLHHGEADAAYSVIDSTGFWLLSVEAKGKGDTLHLPQVARAALALRDAAQASTSAIGVIPFGMKIVGKSIIHTVEFEPLESTSSPMVIASEGLIRLEPQVPGIE